MENTLLKTSDQKAKSLNPRTSPKGPLVASQSIVEFIQVENEKVELRSQVWPIEKLKLDIHNPRLYTTLQIKKITNPTDEKIEDLIWNDPSDATKSLMRSIEATGGLLEAPFCTEEGIVREGNRRLVALRRLALKHADEANNPYLSTLVKVLPATVPERTLMALIGVMHIGNPRRPWDPWEQSRYLHEMHEAGHTEANLSQLFQMSPSKVARNIQAYKDTVNYATYTGDPRDRGKYIFFAELNRYRPTRELRNVETFLPEFFEWLKAGRLRTSDDVRLLPNILADEDAKAAFLKEGAEAAVQILGSHDPAIVSDLYAKVFSTTKALKAMPLDEVTTLADQPARVERLTQLVAAVRAIEKVANVTLVGLEETDNGS